MWHLKVSNYNEKARWALDYKQVPHVRRAVTPGRHRAIARRLAGGDTFPVLILDGETIADSTAIIAALERNFPEPRLYPADWKQQLRALELEEFFDEQLGPHARLLFLYHTLPDPQLMLGAFTPDLSRFRLGLARAAYPLLRYRVIKDYGIDPPAVDLAYDRLTAAGARFRAELQPNGYLTDGGFSVADLTLASLIAPLVAPDEFPYPQPQREHPRLAPLREVLSQLGLLEWVQEIYRRHRGQSAEIPAPSRAGTVVFDRREG